MQQNLFLVGLQTGLIWKNPLYFIRKTTQGFRPNIQNAIRSHTPFNSDGICSRQRSHQQFSDCFSLHTSTNNVLFLKQVAASPLLCPESFECEKNSSFIMSYEFQKLERSGIKRQAFSVMWYICLEPNFASTDLRTVERNKALLSCFKKAAPFSTITIAWNSWG